MTRRISLQNFQQEITRRIHESRTNDSSGNRLAVQVGSENWLIDMTDINEVIIPPQLAQVPLAHDWFLGIANIRGRLYTVVDLSAYAGGEAVHRQPENRLLLTHPRFGLHAALLVDRVLGLRNTSNMHPVTDTGTAIAKPWNELLWQDEHNNIWHGLDMTSLVSNPAFLAAGIA